MFPTTHNILKEYLFYLIDYGVISYDSGKHMFTIEDGGYDILFMIDEEKKTGKTNLNNIVVTFEGNDKP